MIRGSLVVTLLTFLLFPSAPLLFAVEVGDKAPDFELSSTRGNTLKLSSLRGKNVVIQFYVLDYSPGWIRELSSSRDDYSRFQEVNTEILAISANARFSQKAFSDFLKLNFPLLSDFPDSNTSRAYGVFDEKKRLAKRSYFIVDKEGVIRFKEIMPSDRDLLPNQTLIEAITTINKG